MFIIWNRHGYLVLVFYVAALILTQLVVDHVLGDGFYTATAWPKYLGTGVGGLLCWVVGRWLNSGTGRRLVDPETGEEVILPAPSHDFIFIKMEYWGIIGAITCIVLTVLSELGIFQP